MTDPVEMTTEDSNEDLSLAMLDDEALDRPNVTALSHCYIPGSQI